MWVSSKTQKQESYAFDLQRYFGAGGANSAITVGFSWGFLWFPEKTFCTPSLKRWGDSRHSISFSAPHKLKGARRASKF